MEAACDHGAGDETGELPVQPTSIRSKVSQRDPQSMITGSGSPAPAGPAERVGPGDRTALRLIDCNKAGFRARRNERLGAEEITPPMLVFFLLCCALAGGTLWMISFYTGSVFD
jgi:hypothetical protein